MVFIVERLANSEKTRNELFSIACHLRAIVLGKRRERNSPFVKAQKTFAATPSHRPFLFGPGDINVLGRKSGLSVRIGVQSGLLGFGVYIVVCKF